MPNCIPGYAYIKTLDELHHMALLTRPNKDDNPLTEKARDLLDRGIRSSIVTPEVFLHMKTPNNSIIIDRLNDRFNTWGVTLLQFVCWILLIEILLREKSWSHSTSSILGYITEITGYDYDVVKTNLGSKLPQQLGVTGGLEELVLYSLRYLVNPDYIREIAMRENIGNSEGAITEIMDEIDNGRFFTNFNPSIRDEFIVHLRSGLITDYGYNYMRNECKMSISEIIVYLLMNFLRHIYGVSEKNACDWVARLRGRTYAAKTISNFLTTNIYPKLGLSRPNSVFNMIWLRQNGFTSASYIEFFCNRLKERNGLVQDQMQLTVLEA